MQLTCLKLQIDWKHIIMAVTAEKRFAMHADKIVNK